MSFTTPTEYYRLLTDEALRQEAAELLSAHRIAKKSKIASDIKETMKSVDSIMAFIISDYGPAMWRDVVVQVGEEYP
jgi:hypothetical protein